MRLQNGSMAVRRVAIEHVGRAAVRTFRRTSVRNVEEHFWVRRPERHFWIRAKHYAVALQIFCCDVDCVLCGGAHRKLFSNGAVKGRVDNLLPTLREQWIKRPASASAHTSGCDH